ncbi:hypothetical protein B0H10DRAFT_2083620 [Mycena sp. CBHHK59/15]|nr:hypothetical protein B0H10DRAFT_2083620 [Mycena sp. CBHHK59/15]
MFLTYYARNLRLSRLNLVEDRGKCGYGTRCGLLLSFSSSASADLGPPSFVTPLLTSVSFAFNFYGIWSVASARDLEFTDLVRICLFFGACYFDSHSCFSRPYLHSFSFFLFQHVIFFAVGVSVSR